MGGTKIFRHVVGGGTDFFRPLTILIFTMVNTYSGSLSVGGYPNFLRICVGGERSFLRRRELKNLTCLHI